jgi:hypothetical protein
MDCAGPACSVSPTIDSAQDLAVLKKALDAQRLEGQAAVRLIESATPAPAPPPSEPGLGAEVDVVV